MNHKQKLEAEIKAIQYARWLAQRDGVTIKGGGVAYWGNHEHIEKVVFSMPTGEVTVEIPNWNWKPSKIAA